MIYYLTPKSNEPVGGILVLHRHVELLGRRATLVVEEPFDLWWAVPKPEIQRTITLDQFRSEVKPEDTVVVPECRAQWLNDLPCQRKILFVQNMHWYEDLGQATEVMVCSLFLHACMKLRCQLPVHLVYPWWYDEPWYSGKPWNSTTIWDNSDENKDFAKRRPYKLIFIDRRGNRPDIDYLLDKLSDDVNPDDYQIVSGLNQTELAHKLRQSQLYVHLNYPEGFPAPVIEAWLCGCGVVGYAGGGGLEFMLQGHNALIAPDGELDEVLNYIQHALTFGSWKSLAKEGEIMAHNFVSPAYMAQRGEPTAWRYVKTGGGNKDLAYQQLGAVFSAKVH